MPGTTQKNGLFDCGTTTPQRPQRRRRRRSVRSWATTFALVQQPLRLRPELCFGDSCDGPTKRCEEYNPWRIHGAGIYANIGGILMVNVTIYIAYMDPVSNKQDVMFVNYLEW